MYDFFFSSRRRHTRSLRDWSSDVCSSDLVDGDQWTGKLGEEATEAREAEALGRHVDELVAALRHGRHAAAHLDAVHGGGEIGRRDAAGGESVDLVVHEGDERRDDEGGAVQEGGGELIDEALATSGGRHQEEPTDGEERLHRVELPRAKSGVAQPRQPRVEIEPRRGGGLGDAARAHAISRSASATPRGCDRDSWPTTRSRSGTQPS